MILETDNLFMRQIEENDWSLFYQLETDISVQKFVSDINTKSKIKEKFKSRLEKWDKRSSHWLCLVIIDKSTNEKIGVTGFYPEWEPYKQAEVGFMLLPEFHGKGYGKESLIAVLDFALNECEFHKVKATVTAGNDASCHLLKKVGFQQEGIIRDNYKINETWRNDIIFGMFNNELTAT